MQALGQDHVFSNYAYLGNVEQPLRNEQGFPWDHMWLNNGWATGVWIS
jgi:hypothetical protein